MSRGIGVYRRARGGSVEDEDSQRHRTRTDESCLQDAIGRQGSRASDEQVVRTQQKCRHQDDCGYRIRDSQVAPFDPIASAETVGDCKGSPPERGPERHEHHGDEDEENRVTKRDRVDGRLDQNANPSRRQDTFHSIERLGGQCVQGGPLRLLGRQKVGAGGREYVGPPVSSGDQQQDAEQNRVRGKKE
jgi:hypothetical protein